MGCANSLVLCGTKVTTWERIQLVYQGLRIFDTGQQDQDLTAILRDELLAHPIAYQAYRNVKFYVWKKVEDLHTLQQSRTRGSDAYGRRLITTCRIVFCEDPRDKVYGMMSLLVPELSSRIDINYNVDIPKAYADFTRAWIETAEDLNLLAHCGASGEKYFPDETIPSWVVDLKQEIKSQTSNLHRRYQANGEMHAVYQFMGMNLVVRGILFDEVDGCSGVRHFTDDIENHVDVHHSSFSRNPYGEDSGLTGALWRSLVGNRDSYGNEAPESFSAILDRTILSSPNAPQTTTRVRFGEKDESNWLNMHLWWTRNAEFKVCGKPLQHYLLSTNALQRDPKSYWDGVERVDRFLWSRRLITTREGYIGVAPRPTQRGDVILIAGGCSVPLVLRPRFLVDAIESSFEIVGECFVFGVMDGEITHGVQKGTYVLQDIVIS
jgi:hypothetical protein